MQRAHLQQARFTPIQAQATRVLPGHGTGLDNQAVNDDSFRDDSFRDDSFRDDYYRDNSSLLCLVFSVLANVIGGALLLSIMFILPHVIARILG